MHPDTIARYFTRADGTFQFRRWPAPMVPGVFGEAVPDHRLLEATFAEVESITGQQIRRDGDGSEMNATFWFVRAWGDLLKIPGTEGMLGALGGIVKDLVDSNPPFRRSVTIDASTGGIGQMALIVQTTKFGIARPMEERLLRLVVHSQLVWAMGKDFPGLMEDGPGDSKVLSAPVRAILSVAYDPSLPDASNDPAVSGQIADLIASAGS